jgi:hypothetical protein
VKTALLSIPALGFALMATYATVWVVGAAHQLAAFYPTVFVLIVVAAWWGGLTLWASKVLER